MIRRPPRSTPLYSSAASDVYKRQQFVRVHEGLWKLALKPLSDSLTKHEVQVVDECAVVLCRFDAHVECAKRSHSLVGRFEEVLSILRGISFVARRGQSAD